MDQGLAHKSFPSERKPQIAGGKNVDSLEGLLHKWAQQPRHQGCCFIQDGIIDQKRWASVTPRVLFLLKEARHEGPEPSQDLRAFIRENGPYGLTLKNAAYWSYAIHHIALGRLRGFPVGKSELDEAAELFLSSAVVNIKKSKGTELVASALFEDSPSS